MVAMPPSRGDASRCSLPSVGRMCAASFTNWRIVRRSQQRLCAASPCFTPSKTRFGAHQLSSATAARVDQSRLIVDDLHHYPDARNRQVSAKSKLGEAIRYTLIRREGLSRFIDDGRIDLDSNTVERSIRPLALNRKSALFVGSDEGDDNWAVIATLMECCKLNAVNPHEWLTNALTRLADGHPANGGADLMPWMAVP